MVLSRFTAGQARRVSLPQGCNAVGARMLGSVVALTLAPSAK